MNSIFDSELKLMEIVWAHEPISAKELSLFASEKMGWNKNTTYTVIKRLIEKQVLSREEPGFICRSLIKRTEVQKEQANSLIEKLFDGSKKNFFAAFADEKLDEDEIAELKKLIERQ